MKIRQLALSLLDLKTSLSTIKDSFLDEIALHGQLIVESLGEFYFYTFGDGALTDEEWVEMAATEDAQPPQRKTRGIIPLMDLEGSTLAERVLSYTLFVKYDNGDVLPFSVPKAAVAKKFRDTLTLATLARDVKKIPADTIRSYNKKDAKALHIENCSALTEGGHLIWINVDGKAE